MKPEDEALINRWFDLKNLSPGTQVNYRLGIRYYTEITNKTPSELLQEAEEEQNGPIPPRLRSIITYLVNYKNYLLNKLAPATVTYIFIVSDFL